MTDSAPRPPRRGAVPSCPRPGHLASSAPSARPGHTRPPFFSPARRTEPQPVRGLAGRETENDTCLWVTAVEFKKARGPSGTYGRELSPRGGAARAFACGPWAQTGARAPRASPAPPPCTLPGGPRASGAPRSRQPLPHAFKDRDGALDAALPWLCGCFSSPHAQPPPGCLQNREEKALSASDNENSRRIFHLRFPLSSINRLKCQAPVTAAGADCPDRPGPAELVCASSDAGKCHRAGVGSASGNPGRLQASHGPRGHHRRERIAVWGRLQPQVKSVTARAPSEGSVPGAPGKQASLIRSPCPRILVSAGTLSSSVTFGTALDLAEPRCLDP